MPRPAITLRPTQPDAPHGTMLRLQQCLSFLLHQNKIRPRTQKAILVEFAMLQGAEAAGMQANMQIFLAMTGHSLLTADYSQRRPEIDPLPKLQKERDALLAFVTDLARPNAEGGGCDLSEGACDVLRSLGLPVPGEAAAADLTAAPAAEAAHAG